VDYRITTSDEDEFMVRGHVDTRFELDFILTERYPGISATMITSNWAVTDQIFDAFHLVLDRVNGHGGWSLVGWNKPGQGAIQEDQGNNGGYYGQSISQNIDRESTKHIVRLLPFEPQNIDEAHLEGLKVDIRALIAVD
jgi:hypothetical protein